MDIAAVAAAALRHISGVLNGRIKEDSRGRHICGGGRKEGVQLSSPLPLAPVFLGRLQEVIREMRGDSRTREEAAVSRSRLEESQVGGTTERRKLSLKKRASSPKKRKKRILVL